jgi:hypothetical protein
MTTTMKPDAPAAADAPRLPGAGATELRTRFAHAVDHAATRRYREAEFAGAQLQLAVASVRNGISDSLGPASRAMDEYLLAARSALHCAHKNDWSPEDATLADAEDFEQTSGSITALGHRFDAEARCYESGTIDGASFMSGIEVFVADIDRDLRATGAYDRLEPHPRSPGKLFSMQALADDMPAGRKRLERDLSANAYPRERPPGNE